MAGGESNSNKGLNGMMMMLSQNPNKKIQSKIKELENGFQFKIKELENGLQFKIKELEIGFPYKIKELEYGFQSRKEELKGFLSKVQEFEIKLRQVRSVPFVIEAAWGILSGASDGFIIGCLVSLSNKFAKQPMPSVYRFPEELFSGGPIVQARNFAAATAVHGSIMCMLEGSNATFALKSVMIAGFGAGAMLCLVNGMGGSGTISIKNMLATGLFCSLVNGGVHMCKDFSKKRVKESEYTKTRSMLMDVNLEHYILNFMKAELNDDVLPFLTDSSLKEANILPGDRIRILSRIERYSELGQNQELGQDQRK